MRPTYFGSVSAILRKDLLVELRAKQSVPTMTIFAVSALVIFHFALGLNSLSDGLASGVIWVTVLFASILGMNRLFAAEFENAGMEGVLLAPIDRSAVYLAKGLALLFYLVALELVAVPVFALFYLENSIGEVIFKLLPVLALGNLGIAAVGCLVAAVTVHARARELILPVVMLPFTVPLVIAASAASEPVLAEAQVGSAPGKWLLALALFDTVFFLIAFAVFDFLLEE